MSEDIIRSQTQKIHKSQTMSTVRYKEESGIEGSDFKSSKLTNFVNNAEEIDDKYYEMWYDIAQPVQFPLLKYLIAVVQYLVDNFFLIKNTYNALYHHDQDNTGHPKAIAASILGLHIFSSILISIIDSFNKDAIGGRRGKYFNKRHKAVIFFRILAHLTLTMKLFRYTTAYLENRRRNVHLHLLRMRRTKLSGEEIQFIVNQKKNQLVESTYDLVEAIFKTAPAALVQVFFMFQNYPNAKLRLFSTTDQDRFATVFFTIITTSISSANYQCDYLTFKKVLHFQDCFRSGFKHEINLCVPNDLFLITNIPIQIATIGVRICFYSVLIFWSPVQFLITMSVILVVNWTLTFVWNKTAWRFRPVLENPLYGIPWLCFDIIDLVTNLFVPGVHYPKPIDHLLNFYTTLITGIIVFRGFDFLSPTKTGDIPLFLPEEATISNSSDFSFPDTLQYLNYSATNSTSLEHKDSIYFINVIIRNLLLAHEYLTFNQISYVGFFYSVVKFMNIINVICFIYTCVMNFLKMYDLDFPIQIVNDFNITILNAIHKDMFCNQVQFESNSLLRNVLKCEVFLIYSMLPNSKFFGTLSTLKKGQWKSIEPEYLDKLARVLISKENGKPEGCWKCLDKLATILAPMLYPGRFREPKINRDLPIDKYAIINSVRGHPLQEQLTIFIDESYEKATEDRKLLLAMFCANYNEIVRHYTSLRLKKMFDLLEIPIEKGQVSYRRMTASGAAIKNDYELGYWQRIVREAKGKVNKAFPLLD